MHNFGRKFFYKEVTDIHAKIDDIMTASHLKSAVESILEMSHIRA